jgi:hypothetical protein
LPEAEILVSLRKKKFQNFPHHHTWLRRKFCLTLKKKISKFSAPQPLAEAENLLGLREINFKIFRTTIVA